MTHDNVGLQLANRLGLRLPKREGHDLAGPCVACKSSDAFRVQIQSGVAHCFSCDGKWSPFQLAEAVLKDRELAKSVCAEVGIFKPSPNEAVQPVDPIKLIAVQKFVTAAALMAFGAKAISPNKIRLPCYGPDGKKCTTFTMDTGGGKGLFAKGNPAGLFFPHVDGMVRLPQPGEVWYLVEGPKDAAALWDLELFACGLNTCRLASKFARLFGDVEVIVIPDRDRAGEEGGQTTSRSLHGVAKSLKVVALPSEFKESDGADVRDILKGTGGRELLLQAIADAKCPEGWEPKPDPVASELDFAESEIALPDGDPLVLQVWPARRELQRRVVAKRGELEYRDRINTDSNTSRDRFIKKVAEKVGIDRAVLSPLIEPHLTKLADEAGQESSSAAHCGDGHEQSQATIAASIASAWDLWHTSSKETYATIPVADHFETWPIRSQTLKRFLAKQFFDVTGTAINSDAVSAALNLIEAKALFEGEERSVHIRVAQVDDKLYLDLCNSSWQVVEISTTEWKVLDESPVYFKRSRGMLPLPIPEPGGTIDQLRSFINVDDMTWRLVVAWLIANFRPTGPYPVLALFAEQGSGKSTTGRLLRSLIDPNAAPLRAEPRDARDLMIAANNSWCICFDNLSGIPPWLSDALCRLSTGGGFATRELYTDQDETIFDSMRPIMLTSIEEVATRSDLLDRCLIVLLPAIPDDCRRSEAELLLAFEQVRPKILGALLTAVCTALQQLPSIKLPGLPRMADFAVWAAAAETGLGWEAETFITAYWGNRESANDVALEASSIARPLLSFLEAQGTWCGTASELLSELDSRVSDQTKRQKCWPKNARSMSGHLKRLAPNLRTAGWVLKSTRESKQRLVSFTPASSVASSASLASSAPVASSDRPNGVMQSDADPSELTPNDAYDGDDANARVPDSEQCGPWEVGEL